MDNKESKLANMASDAVFVYQLPTVRAVRFITSNIKNTSRKQAKLAIERTMVAYKK